jgi:tetratricopeptide (TPR) repeat protein
MRAFLLCGSTNDLSAITADLDRALKFIAGARTGKSSVVSLLATRAKAEFANGNHLIALNELEKAVQADLGKATEFTNSGEVKPEKTASICVWSQSDMDELVRRFPADYRSHMFRGLYFSKFAPLDDDSLKPALESLSKAAHLNPKSALPQLFRAMLLGDHFVFYKRLNQRGWADAERDKLDAELVEEYGKALALDPNLLPALRGRALAFFHLKQYQKAITDYDRILSLDQQDKATYHDRGLSKTFLGRDYDAISDFSSAIKLKPRALSEHFSYESRADAYVKTAQWEPAIRDLTTAISLQLGGHVFSLMNISQFRAIYPEYAAASDDSIARKLHQTFWPNLKYEDYAESFLRHGAVPSFILLELYLKRSDAYLKKGDWHRALIDFRRAGALPKTYVPDRWREIGRTNSAFNYIDMKTFDDVHKDAVNLWIKEARDTGASVGPYSLAQFELNCRAHRIRALSFMAYNELAELTGSRGGGPWQVIAPDTIGEALYEGACYGGGH